MSTLLSIFLNQSYYAKLLTSQTLRKSYKMFFFLQWTVFRSHHFISDGTWWRSTCSSSSCKAVALVGWDSSTICDRSCGSKCSSIRLGSYRYTFDIFFSPLFLCCLILILDWSLIKYIK